MGIGRGQPYWSQIIQSIMQNVDVNISEKSHFSGALGAQTTQNLIPWNER